MWFLSVGSVMMDTIVRDAHGYHNAGEEQSISTGWIGESAGGMALNTACQICGLDEGLSAPRWSSIRILGRFDFTSSLLRDAMNSPRISPVDLGRNRMALTGRCVCVTRRGDSHNSLDMRRNFYVHTPPGNELSPADLTKIRDVFEDVEGPGWVHFANLGGEPAYYSQTTLNLMRQLRRRGNVRISANTVGYERGLEDLRDERSFVEELDFLVVNVREALTILDTYKVDDRLGLTDAVNAADELYRYFSLTGGIAVTCGAHGAAARYHDERASCPIDPNLLADPLQAIDSVGCGDAWMAGFIDSMAGRHSLRECLVRANKMGTLSLFKEGGSTAVCKRSEL